MGRATRFLLSLRKSRLEAADNTLILHDPSISPHHARIVEIQQKFYVEDLGSQYGTWVNDALVGEYRLAPWDTIRVGIYTWFLISKVNLLSARYRDVRRRGCGPTSIAVGTPRCLRLATIHHSILLSPPLFHRLCRSERLRIPDADDLIDRSYLVNLQSRQHINQCARCSLRFLTSDTRTMVHSAQTAST